MKAYIKSGMFRPILNLKILDKREIQSRGGETYG